LKVLYFFEKQPSIMKPTLLHVSLAMVLLAPIALSKTEVEKLRELVVEQERQIRMLEDENMKLRSQAELPSRTLAPSTSMIANRPKEGVVYPAASAATQSTYTVVAGDNMVKIGRKTQTSAQALARANGLKIDSIIHPGQKLKIPGATNAMASVSGKTHSVESGETFYSISRKHKVSTDALIAANPETKPSALRPGQKLKLPSTNRVSTPAPAPKIADVTSQPVSAPKQSAPVPTPAPAPAADPISPPQSAATAATPTKQPVIRSVMIDGEMTYGQFAAKHGTNPDRLNELNGLDLTAATVLAKGSELYVAAQP